MTPEERTLITGLFDRLRAADASAPAKDRDADDLIRQFATQAPSAPYQLTQTVLVQEHALANAQARIHALEQQLAAAQRQASAAPAPSSGGFLSGLFGGSSSAPSTPPPPPVQAPAPPYPSTVNMPPSAGGGFLRNALATAAGVAGGAMLFQGIENLLGHNSGPFGNSGNLGSGGSFLGGNRPEIIENNYYGDTARHGDSIGSGGSGGDDGDQFSGGGNLGDPIPSGAADQPAVAGHEDAQYDDRSFDASNPFDKPVDSGDFLASRDDGSIENNYDTDNTDAFSGGADLGDSSDFVGNDTDSNDDGYA